MQGRGMWLALVLAVVAVGLISSTSNAFATTTTISSFNGDTTCPSLFGGGAWNSVTDTCTVDSDFVLLGTDKFGTNPDVTLVINANFTIAPNAEFGTLGPLVVNDLLLFRANSEGGFGGLVDNQGVLDVSGEFDGTGNLDNSGNIFVSNGASLSTTATFTNRDGAILETHDGSLSFDNSVNEVGAFVNNTASFTIVDFDNFGDVESFGELDIVGTFTNNPGATLVVTEGEILTDQAGIIDNQSEFLIGQDSDELLHNGLLDNNSGGITTNEGTITIDPFGEIVNSAEFNNDGDIELIVSLTNPLSDFGEIIVNSGDFTNEGTITNSCGKITGTILGEGDIEDNCELFVGISSPTNNAQFSDTDLISFEAVVFDKDEVGDFVTPVPNILWTSSLDGPLGPASNPFSATLSLGSHTITATATGSVPENDVITVNIIGDFDGDGVSSSDGDCDDSDPNNFPGNTEVDDGQDNNCDVTIDEGFDMDGDGFTPIFGGDCDDDNGAINTDATEVDDGVDNNCDFVIDEGFDMDGDGVTPLFGMDCDDSDPNNYPGNIEELDGQDNDCDTLIDEDFGAGMDTDGDGYTPIFGDCDDSDPNNFPTNTEVDDGQDNNCDFVIDEGFDMDGDGFSPVGGMDCDDENISINPGAPELDDGIDNNCNDLFDEGLDTDFDGFTPIFGGDCDDTEFLVNPDATEVDDGKDNNCNSEIDEGFDFDGDGFSEFGGADCDPLDPLTYPGAPEIPDGKDNDCDGNDDFPMINKYTTPEFQENLDNKAVKDFEKLERNLEKDNDKLESENRHLDKKATKYEEKAAKALEDGKPEKAAEYQEKANTLRDSISNNESLIEINDKQILVIQISLGETPIDWPELVIVTYDNLIDEAFDDILDDIKANLREIQKLEDKVQHYEEKAADALDGDIEKAEKYQEKANKAYADGNTKKGDKYQAKAADALEGDPEKAAKYQAKADSAQAEIDVLEDLNLVLECAIDFNIEMLLKEVTYSIKIDRDSDDAEEGNDSDNLLKMKLESSDLDLVEESEYVGLRFNDIPLEKGQTVLNAYIQFTAEDSDKGNADVTIYGHDIDDAPTFTKTDGDISSREVTSASVPWNIADWKNNYSKTAQQTPDITSIVQEVIGRSNWSSDNSMAFVISDGVGKDRDAYTYDEKSSKASVLYITTLAVDLDDDHKHHHGHNHDDDDD